jgi:two-component sensor histidine kinase
MDARGGAMADACDDPQRLAALHRYDILDTAREPGFDQLAELASRLCATPVAVINLIADRRQWFKAEVGLGIRETPLDVSICRHFLLRPGLTVIPDTTVDPLLCRNPLVTADPGFRFYAGCLLTTPEGHALGTLCVLDHRPRDLDETQRFALRTLADQVMAQMELRLALQQRTLLLQEVHHRVRNSLQLVGSVVGLQYRGIADPEARAALEDTARRIRSIAAVHERLHRTDRLDTVELDAFLAGLAGDLQATAPQGVGLAVRAVPAVVPSGMAVSLALLVGELVTNALKYAYPEGSDGSVEIELAPAGEGRLRLSVRDRGQGLPSGFAAGQGRSLGMRLIHAMAAQLGAEARIENAHPGTLSSITFDPVLAST